MREILFRGKNCFGEWVEGFYYQAKLYRNDSKLCDYITIPHPKEKGVPSDHHVVDLETVGQYTGLTDKNGTKIFEGDIVKVQDDIFGSPFCNGITGKVVYDETAFFIEPKNPMDSQWLYNECAVYEVIGNIHDNPELLKGGEQE